MQSAPDGLLVRTTHLRKIRETLAQTNLLYIGAYFGSGKTVLLHQLMDTEKGHICYRSCDDPLFDPQLSKLPTAPVIVLLDDVQALVDTACRSRLLRRLSTLEKGIRVVLAGRSNLPSWLKPLYAANQLALLGQDFCNFTPEEIQALLKQHGLCTTPALVDFLIKNALSWPMGISLSSVRLRNSAETPEALLPRLWQDVYDCFDNVLMFSYDAEIQRFLMHMASFSKFTVDMASFVTGKRDTDAILLRLRDLGSYISLSEEGCYTVHPAFLRYLTDTQHKRCTPEFIAQQYNNAGLFWELQGDISQALQYYRLAGNLDKLPELLMEDAANKAGNGHFIELKEYYDLLPKETILASPELMCGMCIICSLRCEIEESEQWYTALEHFAAKMPHRNPQYTAARSALLYLQIALPHRGSLRMAAILKNTAQLVSSGSLHIQDVNVAGNCPSLLNGGKDFCCWLSRAETMYRYLRTPIETALGRCGVGLGNVALGEALFETGLTDDFTRSMTLLNAGIAEAEVDGDLEMRYAGTGVLCRLFAAQGNLTAADIMLNGFAARLPKNAPVRLKNNLLAQQIRLSLLHGNTSPALQWMHADAPNELTYFIILDRYRYMLKIRIYLAQGQWAECQYLLTRMLQYYRLYHRPYGEAECLLLEAEMLFRRHDEHWRCSFQSALDICEQYQLVRLISDEGVAVSEMAATLLKPDTPYHAALLSAIRQQARFYPRYLAPLPQEHVELTDTEQAVFQLIIAGKKNEEIATILSITVRTVKFHTSNIYRKLNVQSRTQAVKRAAELGEL